MEPVNTIHEGPFTLQIFPDDCPESPARWDNLGDLLSVRFPLESEDPRHIIETYGNIVYSLIPTQDRERHYWIIRKEDGRKEGFTRAQMQKYADGMADAMRMYYEGEIYGFVLSLDGEEIDSCWGFFGEKACEAEGRAILASYLKREADAETFVREAFAL